MNAPVLPGPLADNPRLDRWVTFPAPGKVTVGTGRVELGQGVLTAMAQIAADELGVAMERITIRSGDTEFTPNEGYTAGSLSIQFGGVAMRQACADVRSLFIEQAAKVLGSDAGELTIRDGAVLRSGRPTGQDYWTLAGAVDLAAKATGAGKRKAVADFETIGRSNARLDLPAKIFGEAAFIHDMALDGMVHARVVRQPNRGATIEAIDEQAIKRAAKAPVELVRNGNFLAIVGNDETAVELAGAAAPNHVTWKNVETPTPLQQEAAWLVQRPSEDRTDRPRRAGRCSRARALRSDLHQAAYRARLNLSVLRALALQRRPAHGMDPLPGRVPAAGRAGARPQTRCQQNHRAARAGFRLLRP